ncbi:MAG: 3-oxoacyl-[acyl-carrier-protein] reductase [Lachnospiraceae bacterium]|nr:3-oxoacyl-[acyl-carrier-protein] reductase [Lachnospiraceae bacterium]
MKKFSGQTALVTGASRGIGRAIALALAAEGANVVINYAGRAEAAEATAEECRALGVEAICVQADVSKEEDWARMTEEAKALSGRIDILVNNAGITRDDLLFRISEEDFDAVVKTNLYGCFHGLKSVYRLMMKQKYGRIINISSVVGLHGNAGQANYAAAKAGIVGLTKSMAKELASRGVTVNAVAPGFVATDMTDAMPEAAKEAALAGIPMKSLGKPEDIAGAVLFLADPASRYITGQVLSVDGGMSI